MRPVIDRECTSANSAIDSATAQKLSNKKSFKYSLNLPARVARCRRCQQRAINAAYRTIALQRTFHRAHLAVRFFTLRRTHRQGHARYITGTGRSVALKIIQLGGRLAARNRNWHYTKGICGCGPEACSMADGDGIAPLLTRRATSILSGTFNGSLTAPSRFQRGRVEI